MRAVFDPIPTPLLNLFIPVITAIKTLQFNLKLFLSPVKCCCHPKFWNKENMSFKDMKRFRLVSYLPFSSKYWRKSLQPSFWNITYTSLISLHTDSLKSLNLLYLKSKTIDGVRPKRAKIFLLAPLNPSTALDTIDLWVLVERLFKSFGILRIFLKWLRCYLSGSIQSILKNGLQWSSFLLQFWCSTRICTLHENCLFANDVKIGVSLKAINLEVYLSNRVSWKHHMKHFVSWHIVEFAVSGNYQPA